MYKENAEDDLKKEKTGRRSVLYKDKQYYFFFTGIHSSQKMPGLPFSK